jgi:integrase
LLNSNHLRQLITANQGEHAALNAALIACAAIWGLKAGELAQVTLGDVIDRKGLLRRWSVPASIAFNGYRREVFTEHPSLIKYLSHYLDQAEKGFNDPVFKSPKGGPFKFSGNRPTELNAYFRDLFKIAGLSQFTYKDFRNSLAIEMWRTGGKVTGVKKDIMAYLGIRSYSALDKILKSDVAEIGDSLRGIYKRL